MDYSRLRAAALKSGEDEEAVTVDTRALIDKVLARYSGEWTTLRELIQNAADAQATSVKIKWETLPSTSVPLPATNNQSDLLKHAITNHTLRRLLVENNGQSFNAKDWGRLKRIAEGNPDETKIGAFGVGFYSVFADCEEPFVSSGNQAMTFYWKGNALFTQKLQLPEGQASSNTTFVLDYRDSSTSVPNLLSIGQFLATSLTFVALQSIEFWVDNWKILSLDKKSSPSVDIPIPHGLDTTTRERLMTVSSVSRLSTQIDAAYMSAIGWKPQLAAESRSAESYGYASEIPSLKSFFSRLTATSVQTGLRSKAAREEKAAQDAIAEDVTAISKASIFLSATSAVVQTKVTAAFATELERATKKPPPKATKVAILTSPYVGTPASVTGDHPAAKAVDVFASVLPSKKPGGRVFIGFPTTQTTGGGMHISAPSVIPTVEREAIDLNARWVKTWNVEMLRAAGIITRIAFVNDMAELDSKLRRAAQSDGNMFNPQPAVVARFVPEALHILDTYAFGDSTPSGHVGQIMDEAFWTAYKRAFIEVYSSRGVLPTTKVRMDSETLSKFVDGIPVILKDMKDSPFVKRLDMLGLIKEIAADDIRQELETKALTRDQLVHFLTWAASGAARGELDHPSKRALLDAAVANTGDNEDQGSIIALCTIRNYLVQNTIPAHLPVPPTTIPFAFTSKISNQNLDALGWAPLDLVSWLEFLLEDGPSKPDKQNMMKSPELADQVLQVLSKNWENIGVPSRKTVVAHLENRTVIPTKMGMRKPGEAFFQSVKLFDDLPTIQVSRQLREKFLSAIGVRKTVDLETIFTRLINQSPESGDGGKKRWSHVELIKYLVSVKDDIPASDMKKLKESRICPAEAGPARKESTVPSSKMYKVGELFEPKDTIRTLRLPVLQWPGPPGSFRTTSPEARFLSLLGLRSFPTVPELVDMMASSEASLRDASRTYFIANHHINNYASFNIGATNKAILPLMGNEKQLVPPSACYTNEKAALLGFSILKKEYHQHANKFGVASDPPIVECVNRSIAKPPANRQAAIPLFEYFASRLGDLRENSLTKLRDARIVPVTGKTQGASGHSKEESSPGIAGVRHVRPQDCYLGSFSNYGEIFDFVDFGPNANTFLYKCGSRHEPTKLELARLACSEPARLVSVLQGTERYLNLLRTLAGDLPALKADRELFKKMKTSPFLLASREISSSTPSKEGDEDESQIKQMRLASPNQIVVLDDYISYRLFKDNLMCAPEEDVLEEFYMALGSPLLSSIVREDLKIGPRSEKQDKAVSLQNHVLERSKLFLYEYAKYQRDGIKRDAKWLDKHLAVEMVQSLALRRSLAGRGQSHTEKRSAASTYTNSGHVLYVSTEDRADMYQVGQAVSQLLLNRPNQQAYFFFEPFLKLDLLDLKARGYNVDRILRVKAAEARMAEEERRKALEAERQRIEETEREWSRQAQAASVKTKQDVPRTPEPAMPGSFVDDSPKSPVHAPQLPPVRKSKGLFSNLQRRFGTDPDEEQRQIQTRPPSAPGNPGSLGPGTENPFGAGNGAPNNGKRPQTDDGRVTNPAAVQQNLLNAINATRAHGSSSFFSPPRTNEVKEQATYCDSHHAHDLAAVAQAPRGMQVLLSRDVSVEPGQFLSANTNAITLFEALLRDVAEVYSVSYSVVHIFYDEVGPTIAFNSNGSIFCNLRYFIQLHAIHLRTSQPGQAKVEAAVYWWVVLAHELAHNLESSHNSDHSFYTESFVQQYFPKMMAKAESWMRSAPESNGGDAARGSLPPPPSYQAAVDGGLQSAPNNFLGYSRR